MLDNGVNLEQINHSITVTCNIVGLNKVLDKNNFDSQCMIPGWCFRRKGG